MSDDIHVLLRCGCVKSMYALPTYAGNVQDNCEAIDRSYAMTEISGAGR